MMQPPATTSFGRRLLGLLIIGGLTLNIALLGALLFSGTRLNSDFMAFWSYPRFVAENQPQALYDGAQLMAFQQHLYPGFHSFYPYLYPPTLLLPLYWLKFLPFGPAECIWTILGLAALWSGIRAAFPTRPLAVLAGLLASPAALICASTGETAFFTTALLLGGFACLPRRPILAGLWFGLLTLKPQLGVLIPFFLLARWEWRAIFSACATALIVNGLSLVFLPAEMWTLWWQTLPAYQANYFSSAQALNLNILVTPAANLIVLGASQTAAWAVQTFCGLAMILLTVWMARRAPYRLAVAAILLATFLAQPHAYAYDSIAAIAGLALALEAKPAPWMLLVFALTFLFPWVLLSPLARHFLDAPLLAACLLSVLILARKAQNGADSGYEPDPLLSAAKL